MVDDDGSGKSSSFLLNGEEIRLELLIESALEVGIRDTTDFSRSSSEGSRVSGGSAKDRCRASPPRLLTPTFMSQ